MKRLTLVIAVLLLGNLPVFAAPAKSPTKMPSNWTYKKQVEASKLIDQIDADQQAEWAKLAKEREKLADEKAALELEKLRLEEKMRDFQKGLVDNEKEKALLWAEREHLKGERDYLKGLIRTNEVMLRTAASEPNPVFSTPTPINVQVGSPLTPFIPPQLPNMQLAPFQVSGPQTQPMPMPMPNFVYPTF